MKIYNNIKFDFNDIVIVPKTISGITSRKSIKTESSLKTYPLIVSPMDTVIDTNNYYEFVRDGLVVCLPRGIPKQKVVITPNTFISISLDEFETYVNMPDLCRQNAMIPNILVDIANGHMERLKKAVIKFNSIKSIEKLIIGNIANPETYAEYAKLDVDMIRVGIGGGSACTTSANTGVHYPMASLIKECYEIKKSCNYKTEIIADGGFRNFDEIIKALALGADYVMLGGILNKCIESCGKTTLWGFDVSNIKYDLWQYNFFRKRLYNSYRGMSTKEVQKTWGKLKLKTAEGISKKNKVEYSIRQWINNFDDYLKSAMSYCGAKNLEEFKGSDFVFITENAFKRFHK